MDKKILLTRESYNKLEEELEFLSTTKRLEIAKNLKIAAEFGDLKENAEFDAEKQNQAIVESRILDIKNILMNSIIIDRDANTNTISLGSEITLFDLEFDENIEYKLVDTVQSDPLNGLISYDSPMGKALMNKCLNDIIEVDLPYGKSTYKIIGIK